MYSISNILSEILRIHIPEELPGKKTQKMSQEPEASCLPSYLEFRKSWFLTVVCGARKMLDNIAIGLK